MARNNDLFDPFNAYVEEFFPQSSALRVLQSLLLNVWCAETAFPTLKARWTPLLPTIGQADVTAMAVQNALGGTISEMDLGCGYIHYFNRVPDECGVNTTIDIVRPDLPEKRPNAKFTSYRAMLTGWQSANACRGERYDLLKKRLRERLEAGP